MLNKLQHGTPASATATGGTATATITGIAGAVMYITDVAGSTDKAGGLLVVKQGTTVVWQVQLQSTAAGYPAFQQSFQCPIPSAAGASVSCVVDGTSVANANINAIYL